MKESFRERVRERRVLDEDPLDWTLCCDRTVCEITLSPGDHLG